MSLSLLDQYRYAISDIKVLDLPPNTRSIFRKSIFRLEIAKITSGDNELLKSVKGKIDKNRIVWSRQTLYDVTAGSTINFKILMWRGKEDASNIGEYTDTMSGLLDMQRSSDSGICKVTLGQKSQLSFTIKEDRFKDIFDKAKQESEGIYFAGGTLSWSTFLTYFERVQTAADSVSSLNIYSQQVWSIVLIVPNILQMHVTRNSNVQKLFERLVGIYKYINEADRLSALTETQSDKLKLLIETTGDCVDFIRKYTENNAGIRYGPSFDNRISKFKESFDEIFKTIQDFLILKIGITTSHLEDFKLLSDIPYADNVGLDKEKIYLPGTRQKLIREIVEWVHKENMSERVLILSGQAGSGKSAVAHTIAKTLNDRLGSFFSFNRGYKGRVNLLFSTISRDLADGDVLWRRNLVRATEETAIRKSLDPITQFDEMIIRPSIGMEMTKRVVIIIDALDESGDEKERKTLLNLLFIRSLELPMNYRIIITSRPEHDIAQFYQHPNVFCKYMADVDPDDTLNDIQQFISFELSDVAETLDTVDKNWCLLLAQKAQSIFQWAKIACVYILELEELVAAQRLRTILSKSTSSLYEMYHQILDAQPGCQFDSYLTLLKTCVGAVMVSRKPLSVSDLQAFFGPICGGGKNVKVILKSMNSLFIGTNESTANIRPIHTSLFDFFLDPEQKPGTPNRYYIDVETSDQSSFAYACLRVMNEMLRFNICGLETSYLRNRDVPDFGSRVAEAIPSHLSYACCFWAYHLKYSSLNTDLLGEINDLMCNKLLYFFEVLSLLGEIERGRIGMRILQIKTKEENSELAARAAEASQFAFEFGTMMMESTPHLYLSSLPYISNRSFISQQFLPQYPQLLSMDFGQPITLRSHLKDSISQKHPSACPSAVAFSPRGGQIASGFDNGDLWVWDYVTGEMVSQVAPKEEPTAICNVVFSLNGELVYCCFKDGSILTWEAKTDEVLYESNEGLAPEECDDCTISPDGRYIAFRGGYDDTLSFYERETRVKHFGGSKFAVMMFSPNGNLFGFQPAGQDRAFFWDTQRQSFIPPFGSITEHHWFLEALNDNYVIARVIASSQYYEVWDIRSRTTVLRFKPETASNGIFTFSPNGEYLLRTEGNRRWIWKILTGEITQRFVEHSNDDHITFTAISPDSKYTAFTMDTTDTIHVLAWDDLVQEEEDLSKDIEEREVLRYMPPHRTEAWLKGQHLLQKVQDVNSRGYLRVLDTTRMTGLEFDFEVDFSDWPLVEVSPEDNHWSIAYYVDESWDLLCLWNIDEKKVFVLDRPDEEKVTALAFSAAGDHLISGDAGGNIEIWHVRTRQLISHGGLSKAVTALAFSPTGTTFWVAYGTDAHAHEDEDEDEDKDEDEDEDEDGDEDEDTNEDAKAFNIEERECSESFSIINGPFMHNSYIRSISVSSNNTYICVCADAHDGSGSYDPLFLEPSTGASMNCFNTPQSVIFSSNRRYIAWMHRKNPKNVGLWDLEKGVTLDGFLFDGKVMTLGFSSDSRWICILGDVGKMDRIDIWDIETKGLVMQLFFSNFQSKDTTLALYEDSLLWVGTRDTGRIWDLHVHEIMTRLYDDNLDNSQSDMLPRHLQTRRLINDYRSRSENTEVLDYALGAWNKAIFSPRTKESEDGWMLGPHGELLFWVSPKMRSGLWYPSMSFTAHKNFTKLNFDKFVHGTRWTECRKIADPLKLKTGIATSNIEDFKRLGDIPYTGQQGAPGEVIPDRNSSPNEDDGINTEMDGGLGDDLVERRMESIRETSVEYVVPEIPPSPLGYSIDLVCRDGDYDGSDVGNYDTTSSPDPELPEGHSTHALRLSGESRSQSEDVVPEIPPSPLGYSIDLVCVDGDYDGSDVDNYDTTSPDPDFKLQA